MTFSYYDAKRACSSLLNIVKTWSKEGKLDPADAIRCGILVADIISKNQKHDSRGRLKRKSFSQTIQSITLIKQDKKCNICMNKLDEINFDHIDGNRSNNSISNCQALCPNCHAKKTRKMEKRNQAKIRN